MNTSTMDQTIYPFKNFREHQCANHHHPSMVSWDDDLPNCFWKDHPVIFDTTSVKNHVQKTLSSPKETSQLRSPDEPCLKSRNLIPLNPGCGCGCGCGSGSGSGCGCGCGCGCCCCCCFFSGNPLLVQYNPEYD